MKEGLAEEILHRAGISSVCLFKKNNCAGEKKQLYWEHGMVYIAF